MRIAVVGAGVAGLHAAWRLARSHDVTVFEKDDRLGGHACTHVFDYDGETMNVDLGFIVYNGLNYPNLIGFFDAGNRSSLEQLHARFVTGPIDWAARRAVPKEK